MILVELDIMKIFSVTEPPDQESAGSDGDVCLVVGTDTEGSLYEGGSDDDDGKEAGEAIDVGDDALLRTSPHFLSCTPETLPG